jgi:hypothetical protein
MTKIFQRGTEGKKTNSNEQEQEEKLTHNNNNKLLQSLKVVRIYFHFFKMIFYLL